MVCPNCGGEVPKLQLAEDLATSPGLRYEGLVLLCPFSTCLLGDAELEGAESTFRLGQRPLIRPLAVVTRQFLRDIPSPRMDATSEQAAKACSGRKSTQAITDLPCNLSDGFDFKSRLRTKPSLGNNPSILQCDLLLCPIVINLRCGDALLIKQSRSRSRRTAQYHREVGA